MSFLASKVLQVQILYVILLLCKAVLTLLDIVCYLSNQTAGRYDVYRLIPLFVENLKGHSFVLNYAVHEGNSLWNCYAAVENCSTTLDTGIAPFGCQKHYTMSQDSYLKQITEEHILTSMQHK